MGTSTIIYTLSVVASLYAIYLIAYCLYDVSDSWEKREPKRIILPRIAYISSLIVAFIPVLNTAAVAAFILASYILIACDDWQIDSWLFEKPEVKTGNTDNNPEKK